MPRSNNNKKTASKKQAAGSTGKSNARFVVCPYTDQKVFVAQATLQDLKGLTKGNGISSKQKRLWTIASATIRQEHYLQVAQAIAKVEQDLLPSYGGRSWEVSVGLTEPNGRVLFRSFKGKMELAVLPHLLERIPAPPAWPGKRCGQPPDEYDHMQGEVAEAVAKRKQFHSEQEYIASLTTRGITNLSAVAYEVLRGRPYNHPVPTVTTKWKSPDAKSFTSRKTAWEYAEILSKQEVTINRNLLGVGASGKLLQVFTPSPKTALEVGQMRFIRDGLWVVGQELAWQADRPAEWQAQQEEQQSQPKVYKSGLQLYVATHRQDMKEEHDVTLTEADKELRKQWRQLSPSEQQVWNDKCQEQLSESSKEEESEEEDGSGSEQEEEVEYVSPLAFFIEKRRQDYRYERQMELIADKFTLAQADRELRAQWKEMTEEEQDQWIVKLGGDVEAEDEEEKNDEDCSDNVHFENPETQDIEEETKSLSTDETLISATGDGEKTAPSHDQSNNVVVDEKKDDEAAKEIVVANQSDETPDVNADIAPVETTKRSSPATVSEGSASNRSQRAKQPPARISSRWCMKPKHISLCHDACMEHYETVMRTVKNRDLARELADGFDVLRERGHGRFDMELPSFETKEFDFLNDFKKTPWMPVVHSILGEDVVLIHKGCFLSLPGAGAQVYHQDGVHLNKQSQQPCHAINVFVPLVDLQTKNGPTEFVLGSHVLGHDGYDRDFLETPKPTAGTPVIFDYRLGHRGLANSSHTCRPIVYCTYARAADGKEFRDQVNFSRKRYHKIGDLATKPMSREERRNKRKRSLFSKEEEDLQRALELSKKVVVAEESESGSDRSTEELQMDNDDSENETYEKLRNWRSEVATAEEDVTTLPTHSKVRDLYSVSVPSSSVEPPSKKDAPSPETKVQNIETIPMQGVMN